MSDTSTAYLTMVGAAALGGYVLYRLARREGAKSEKRKLSKKIERALDVSNVVSNYADHALTSALGNRAFQVVKTVPSVAGTQKTLYYLPEQGTTFVAYGPIPLHSNQ
jgi:hypothetical protein